MSWQTPKTDWASSDGVRDTDMNRIEENIRLLGEKHVTRIGLFELYVSSLGSDTTGDGTSSKPYKTITRALSDIPVNLDGNDVTIYIDSGIYSELHGLNIVNYSGGSIRLVGTGTGDVQIMSLFGVTISNCAVSISGRPFKIGNDPTEALKVTNGADLFVEGDLEINTAASNGTGLTVTGSRVHVGGIFDCSATTFARISQASIVHINQLYAGVIAVSSMPAYVNGSILMYGSATANKFTFNKSGGGQAFTGGGTL